MRYLVRVIKVSMGMVALVGGPGTMAQGVAVGGAPSYAAFTQSYVLPYANPEEAKTMQKVLKVHASVNGGPVGEFTVDTGSVGMIVGADEVPNIDPKAEPGQITYSSSGVQLRGVWTTAKVEFPEAKGYGGVATAVIPVLAVMSEACTGTGVNADHCHALAHPHPHMLGIGFGRGQESHPEKNAFENLREMQAGTMRRGYVISRDGIVLGLTAKSVGEVFVWQKLVGKFVSQETAAIPVAKGATALKDWEGAPGTFEVGGVTSPMGSVLMDTGLTNMILANPDSVNKGDVPDGTPVSVGLLGGKLSYSFKVGDGSDPATPRRVSWVAATHGVFVNTGLHALAGFDYLFDADGGWLALRPVK